VTELDLASAVVLGLEDLFLTLRILEEEEEEELCRFVESDSGSATVILAFNSEDNDDAILAPWPLL
jgi:hypothetical protein